MTLTTIASVGIDFAGLKALGQAVGIAGVCVGALVLVFRDVIRRRIFPRLQQRQSYRLLTLIIVLTWSVAIAGIAAWAWASRKEGEPRTQSPATNNTKIEKLLEDGLPAIDHPVVDLSVPITGQLQLFPEDEVAVVGWSESVRTLDVGRGMEPFASDKKYIVQGPSGLPITPKFEGKGIIKLEVRYTKNRDKSRDLRADRLPVKK